MQQTTNTTKIQYIPTELNWITYTQKQLKRHRDVINISRLFIIALLIWNLCITLLIFRLPDAITKDAAIIPIEMLQEVPTTELQHITEN